MAINPLQLPTPIRQPELDWSRLDAIGDSIARYRQDQRELDAVNAGIDAARAPTAQPNMPAPAQQRQMMPRGGAPDDLDVIAQRNGLNPGVFKRIAQVESGGNPEAVSPSGQHGGLFQLDMQDFINRGGKNVFDPTENATIAARRLAENNEALRRRLGRDPTPTELYLSHQQGLGGVAAHLAAPDRPAWQSMMTTAEGRQKGEQWAKSAIWGNIPDALKQRFGSVDNITSRDFMALWQARVEAPDQPQAPQQPGITPPADPRMLTDAQAKRLRALAESGPAGRRAVMELLAKQGLPRDPVKMNEGDILIDPNRIDPATGQYAVVGRAPGKAQAVREGGALVQDGRVVYQAPGRGNKVEDDVAARQRIAEQRGLQNDPQTKIWVLTGKHPGEDRVSPTALKAIMEAEDENAKLDSTVQSLRTALDLNDKIYTGFGAGVRTWLGTQLPDLMVPDAISDPRKAQISEQWSKIMQPEALSAMANTLKGATTDFELRTFIGQLADPRTTPETRKSILERMIRLSDTQRKINQARMDELRGGTYTKPGGGQSSTQRASVTQEMVTRARENPESVREEARRAIQSGAPRDAVIRRLQQLKVSTDGL